MSDCKRNECGECLPDYRYFINQQQAVFNTSQTVTVDCPVGYECNTVDPVTVGDGQKKIIPDLPPYDPDQDPNCDSLCEINTVVVGDVERDSIIGLSPHASVGNVELTVTCQDINLNPDGLAQYTLPANSLVFSYNPQLTSRSVAQEQVNQMALDYGKTKLAEKIASGVMNCNGWEIGYSTAYYPAGNVIETTPTGYHIIATEHVPYQGGVGEGQIQPQTFYKNDTRIAKEFGPYDTDKVIRQSGSVRFVGSITAPSPYLQWWNSCLISYFDPSKDVWDISANRYQEGRDPGSQLFIYSISDRYAGYNIDETYPFDITYNLTAGMSVKCGGSCWSDNRFNGYSYVEITLEVAIEDV